jgi:hypothetical protein
MEGAAGIMLEPGHRKLHKRGGRGAKRGKEAGKPPERSLAGDVTPTMTNAFLTAVHQGEEQGGSGAGRGEEFEGVDAFLERIAYTDKSSGGAPSTDAQMLLLRPKETLAEEVLSLRRQLAAAIADAAALQAENILLHKRLEDAERGPPPAGAKRARTGS